MDFAVPKKRPPTNGRTRSKRRSSILKTAKPLEEIQNVSGGDDRLGKSRRVSFANKIEVKEFSKEKPTHAVPALVQDGSQDQNVDIENTKIASDDTETEIMISTPKKHKRRRVSATTSKKIERLSIIPKVTCNSSPYDEDFGIYEDNTESAVHVSKIKSPMMGDSEHGDDCGSVTQQLQAATIGGPSQLIASSQNSDMELTCIESLQQADDEATHLMKQQDIATTRPPINLTPNASHLELNTTFVAAKESSNTLADIEETCIQTATPKMSDTKLSLGVPESVQSSVISSQKKKQSTPPRVLVASSSLTALSCQLKRGSYSLLEHHLHQSKLLSGSKSETSYLCPEDKEDTCRSTCKSDDYLKEAITTVEVVDMQLEESLEANKVSAMCTPSSVSKHSQSTGAVPSTSNVEGLLDDQLAEVKTSGMWLTLGDTTLASDSCLEISAEDHTNLSEGSLPTVESRLSDDPPASNYTPELQKPDVKANANGISSVARTINTLKTNVEQQYNVLDVNTPELLPVELPTPPAQHTTALTHITFSQDESTVVDSYRNRQSLLMSPSGFSKFLVKLDCDKTIVEEIHAGKDSSSHCLTTNIPAEVPNQQVFQGTVTLTKETSGHSISKTTTVSDSEAQLHALGPVTGTPSTKEEHVSGEAVVNIPGEEVSCEEGSSVHVFTSTEVASDQVKVSFDDCLQIVHHRLTEVLDNLTTRLSTPEYLKTHEAVKPSLEKLTKAAKNGIDALTMLLRYGELSGQSKTYQWDSQRVTQHLPSPVFSQDDITGNSHLKAEWIKATHTELLLKFYPIITTLMEEAANLFPWQLALLNNDLVEITYGSRRLTLRFGDQENERVYKPFVKSMNIQPKDCDEIRKKMLGCHCLTDVAEAYLHSRMRARTNALLKVLNRARPEKKVTEKKTISGRTFARKN